MSRTQPEETREAMSVVRHGDLGVWGAEMSHRRVEGRRTGQGRVWPGS